MSNSIYSGLAINLNENLLKASLPLFESEKVDAIEFNLDPLLQHSVIPDWFAELLTFYGQHNRLIGHGVFFSIFSGKFSKDQKLWLQNLKKLCNKFTFDHISEHFGFMTGEDFHKGAPLSIPYTKYTLEIGIDRIKRIQEAANCPTGIENLAFAYSLDEVRKQGEFIGELLNPVNGFLILDLHNLYCQSHNFDIDFIELLNSYPLNLVREIHISGGSWENSITDPNKKIRRDTHDIKVPKIVFDLLS